MSEFDQLEFTETEVTPILAAQIAGECGMNPSEIKPAISKAFDTLCGFMQSHGLEAAGPPRTIYTSYSPTGMKFIVAAPVVEAPAEPVQSDEGTVGTIEGCKALRFTHRGSYEGLMATYGRITAFLKARDLMQSEADWARFMPMWEEYLNDPHTTPEDDLLTYIYLPAP